MIILSTMMSHTRHQPLVVGCCMEQYSQSAHQSATSFSRKRNPMVQDMTKERIRKLFEKVELSASAYDTAWVAMVPSPNSPLSPCFPDCLKWVMDNQLDDGSWGLVNHTHHLFPLVKDTLSSTLASIVALKKWNVGEYQINKGLSFIESNLASASDENEPSPVGFDIIFPHMLEHAKDLSIKLPLEEKDLRLFLHKRELELKRCHSKERESYMAYISEGLGSSYDLNMVMKYQMKNGSILNSPSASSAALIHHENVGCLNYLTSVLKKFGSAVPTLYPLDLYVWLYMVDQLERLGITRHFTVEIQTVLDEAYRCWMQRDEQIFMNAGTCALAFRVLRTNGYQISSDPLAEIMKEGSYMSPYEEPFEDICAALEAYRASQIIFQDEPAFGELNLLSADFLKRKTTPSNRLSKYFDKQVDDAFKYPFNASLERVSTRRNIQNYIIDDTRISKTTYRSSNISNEDYIKLAKEDFNACQSIHLKEWEDLERWVVENNLDKIKSRQLMGYCYFVAASIYSSRELSDARYTWAKAGYLITILDDFFDIEGSMGELENLIQCIEKWIVNVNTDCCSEEVSIMFLALKDFLSWMGDAAYKWQKRDVTSHVTQCWLRLINSMLAEAKWARDRVVPTFNEYIKTGCYSIGGVILILPSIYFIGPKLSEDIVQSAEYHNLFELTGTHSRLFNDIRSYKRELKEGKLNAVTLHKNYGKSGIEEEEIVEEIKIWIKDVERKVMQLVMETKESNIPKDCKDVFWKMCCIMNFFYGKDDGFSGSDILNAVKEVIYEPV
uniref:ent-kaurene synthase n=1 Tax=Stevia rebaudiana TaxID=55670 RepID=A0A0P0EVW3_STERE|nr:kaurene synthase-like protein [Stevia rebaudiana]